jgi:5'-nucleotidase
MIIGVDIDNTAGDYTGGFTDDIAVQLGVDDLIAHAEAYGPPVDYAMSNWPGFPAAFTALHTQAVQNGLYRTMKAYPGVSETLWKLSDEGHHLRIITSRFVTNGQNSKVVRDTGIWLDDNNIPYRDIMFTSTKVDIFADVYIDDSPHNIEVLRAAGREVIIYDAPYNQGIPGRRAYNWDEVYAHIQDLMLQEEG